MAPRTTSSEPSRLAKMMSAQSRKRANNTAPMRPPITARIQTQNPTVVSPEYTEETQHNCATRNKADDHRDDFGERLADEAQHPEQDRQAADNQEIQPTSGQGGNQIQQGHAQQRAGAGP